MKLEFQEVLKRIDEACKEKNCIFLGFVEKKWDTVKTTHLIIQCKFCGNKWETLYRNFVTYKHGCKKCFHQKLKDLQTKSLEKFINDAKQIHNNKYDYSKVEYVNSKTKVCIICPIHGEFWQTPNKHLSGKGCRKCSTLKNTANKIKPIEEVKLLFEQKHGNKYQYDWSTYISMDKEMKMVCPIHGEFWQKPYFHSIGNGCKFCNESHLERDVKQILMDNKIDFIQQASKKVFSWVGRQSFDFFIPSLKILIECQGKQHFHPVKYFGGDEEFKKIMHRDLNKKNLAEIYNLKLFYIINDDVEIDNLTKEIYNINNTIKINQLKNILKS